MLQVARLAPNLPPEAAERVAPFTPAAPQRIDICMTSR